MSTIKDVAALSGVSTATVSYILNNRAGHLRPETRERVLRAMRELKYRPSALARGRESKRSQTIGVIYKHSGGRRLVGQPYYTYLLDGIMYFASSCQWSTTLFGERNWDDALRSLRVYCDGRCDGLILIGPDAEEELVGALQERGTPFVLINAGSQNPDISSVDVDNVAAAREIVTFLLECGHRRIAMLPGNSAHESSRQRSQGFLEALGHAGIADGREWILEGRFSEESGYERTIAVMAASDTQPTALFCGTDLIARGAYRALAELGLAIPTAVSVVGFDDLDFAATMVPPLTTMRQPLQQIGERAAEILLSLIEENPNEPAIRKEIVPTQLIERGSVATAVSDNNNQRSSNIH